MTWLLYLVPLAGIAALVFAHFKARWVEQQDEGDDTMKEIAGNIADGARAFLKAEYTRLAVFVGIVAVALTVAYIPVEGTSFLIGVSFLVGAAFSGLAGFYGMKVATLANVRTAHAARTGLAGALQVAFSGGLVMGLTVVGLGLVGLSGLYIVYDLMFVSSLPETIGLAAITDFRLDTKKAIATLSGFSLGASSIALFARVGGGIYTKAADVGADLAGKVYAGIPEDDPRNPATIADNVGDNVGDVAGMGADLFESYVGSILGTMLLGAAFIPAMIAADAAPLSAVILPLVLAAVGALVAIGGSFLVKTKDGGNPQHALNLGEFASAGVMLALSAVIILVMLPSSWTDVNVLTGKEVTYTWWGVLLAVAIGLISGLLIGLITEYYCSTTKNPTFEIAKQSTTGSATNIISGLAVGMMSTGGPIIVLALGIVGAAYFAGLYGIAIAAVGLLSVLGIQLAVDAYGPIS
ncbi:MAG: sodium/proton-translocating pyrophosphatase, partial [Planctomycetota bacterium]